MTSHIQPNKALEYAKNQITKLIFLHKQHIACSHSHIQSHSANVQLTLVQQMYWYR